MKFYTTRTKGASANLFSYVRTAVVKFASFTLVFSFIVTPFAPVFAQESPVKETGAAQTVPVADSGTEDVPQSLSFEVSPAGPEEPVAPVSSMDPEPQAENQDAEQNLDELAKKPAEDVAAESLSMSLQEQESAGARDLAKVQAVGPNEVTASLAYGYPIVVPPGRNGLQPNLQLVYDSNARTNTVFGSGWSINIPKIERINKKGTDTSFSQEYFASTFDEELVKVNSTTYQARVESGGFNKYLYSNNVWTVSDKGGLTYKFGSTTAARQDNPDDSSEIAVWYLEEVRDLDDNYIKFEYYKDNGQIYPSKITYTGNGSTDGIFDVEFSRESRTDIATTSDLGFPVVTKYRISEIRTEVSDTWAHKYTLGYTTSDNDAKSVLSSIVESGQDDLSNVVTLPAETYTYATAARSWTQGNSWNFPEVVILDGKDQGVRFLDANGDGWVDIVRSYSSSTATTSKVYLNDGDSWEYDSSWSIPEFFVNDETDLGVRFGDVNGDGLTDLMRSYTDGTQTKKVYLNTGTGWSYDSNWSIPEIVSSSGYSLGVQFLDVNGDGLTDLVRSYDDGTSYKKVYINDGDSWEYNATWSVPEVFISTAGDTGVRFGDVNGDGLPDLVRSDNNGGSQTNKVYLNSGGGWSEDVSWSLPVTIAVDGKDQGVQLGDVNGDGLTDILHSFDDGVSTTRKVYVNEGEGWQYDSDWTIPTSFVFSKNGDDLGTRIIDADADNVLDLFRSHSSSSNETNALHEGDGDRSDLLKKITFSKGGNTTVAYTQTTQYRSGSTLLNPNLPQVLDVVSSVTHNSLLNTFGLEFVYGGGTTYFNGPFDRRFAGFATTSVENDLGHKTKSYVHQGNATNASEGEYSDNAWKIGRPYRVDYYDGSDALYKRTVNKWDDVDLGNSSHFVKLARNTELTYDGDVDHKDRATTYTYDVAGNVTQQEDWGEVTASTDGSFTDTGSDKRTMVTMYASSASPYLVAPSTETLYDYASIKTAEGRAYYDQESLGTITKGKLTKKEKWATTSTYIDLEYSYNTYGLVTQEKDPRDKVTSYTYDTYNLYPATTTNPIQHTVARVYDYSSGAPKREVDPNGYIFETVYDGLDRVLEEKQPDVTTPSTLVTKNSYAYVDTGTTSVRTRHHLDGSTSYDTYTYFDGLGRPVQEKKATENASEFVTKDIVYNSIGKEERTSLPYFTSSASSTAPTDASYLWIDFTYDALGRTLIKHAVVGTSTYVYDDWKVSQTDAEGNVRHLYNDATGALTRVDEVNGASTYTTTYQYNANNNLTKITDALGNVRTMSYNGLGYRTMAEDLHAPADTTFGVWNYTYDAAGNITTLVDAKGQTINYTFDDLNRILTENWTGATSSEAEYAYDNCANGKGRICIATSTKTIDTPFAEPLTSSLSLYEYDSLGRVSKETKHVDKYGGSFIGTYATEYEYNRAGDPTLITYPDGSEVKNSYNAGGLLETVQYKESGGASFSSLITDLDYSPAGDLTYRENANNTFTTYTYNEEELYRLRSVKTEKSGVGGSPESLYIPDYVLLADEVVAVPAETITAESVAQEGVPVENEAPVPVVQEPKGISLGEKYQDSNAINQAYTLQGTTLEKENGDVRIRVGGGVETPEPTLTLTKWNEVTLQLGYPTLSTTGRDVQFENEKITIGNDTEQVRYYELPPSKELPGGGYEVDVVLTNIPKSNTISFDIATEGLEFVYQPPLDEELHGDNISSCTATECTNADGKAVARRAEHVVGSYAVNAADKFGDHSKLGGNDYGTGKAFHIYRPKITDNAGASVWGELDIDERKGRLTVTVPQDFLDTATYPVVVDPTFGYTSAGGSEAYIGDYVTGSLFTTTSEDGTVDSIHYHGTVDASSIKSKAAYYTHSDLALVAAGSENTGGHVYPSYGWFTSTVSGSPDLDPSTEYVLVAWGEYTGGNDTWLTYDSGSSNQGHYDSQSYGTSFPDPLNPSHENRKYSVYVTYTAASSNSAPTAPSALLAEGQTNPTNITDPTPEFSAIYNDPDSGDSAVYYQLQVSTSSSDWTSPYWDSTKTSMTTTTEGARSPDITYGGSTLASSTAYYWRIKFWDDDDAEGAWSTTTSSFSLAAGSSNAAPTAPSALLTEGQTNPANITDSTPEFSALYNDPDSGDTAANYQIQVSMSSSDWTGPYWNSGKSSMASTTAGNRSPDISYRGSTLASSTAYYWRIKFWDDDDAEGDWSTTTASFSLAAGGTSNATPTAPSALLTEGHTNPTDITDPTPEFSAIYNDPDSGDNAIYYQLQVATSSSDWSTLKWDSTKAVMSTTTEGARSPDITYGGSTLASSTTYYWRIKFWDDDDAEGIWSTTTSSFSLAEEVSSGATTTVTIYPESGDGYVDYNLGFTWSAAHDASTGLGSSDSASSASVNVGKSGFWYEISRGFIPFDTSSIPANATVTAATLHVYVNSKQNDDNDGSDYVTVIESTTGSTASLNVFDYSECGATDNPTEGIDTSERKDISGITTGQYLSFDLNATGTAWIDTGSSGTAKLCLREGHDTTDSAFSGSSGEYNEIVFATVEATGTSTDPYLEVTYIGGTSGTSSNPNAPTASTDLETDGQTNPTAVIGTTPEFTAIYNDPNTNDFAAYYQIQVATSSGDWANAKWDSSKSSYTNAANEGERSDPVAYSGSALATSTTYYWRIKFWDWADNEGVWSTSTATFQLSDGPVSIGLIEERTYTYDKVGNVTQLVDTSETGSAATTTYVYDDLHRLTRASTTDATSTPYIRTFEYTAIGNIASSSDVGVYSYNGDTSTSEGYKWANPHAVTSIKLHGDTLAGGQSYDKNGNMTAGGIYAATDANSYVWDHNNNLIEAYSPEGFTMGTYFDHEGSRVILRTGSTEEWHYPNRYYSVRYDTAPYTPVEVRKNVYAGDKLVATVQGTSTDALVFYNHLDHLGSTRAVTEYDGDTVEVQDHYPFGSSRVNERYADFTPKKKFTGHEWDETVGVYYMGARYYDPEVKRFLSQDPIFWGDITKILNDPQQLNSYSYARNNPLSFADPSGELVELVARLIFFDLGAHLFFHVTPGPFQGPMRGDGDEGWYHGREFTLGAYNRSKSNPSQEGKNPFTNVLVKDIGMAGETAPNTDWKSGSEVHSGYMRIAITPPDDMTDDEFVSSLLRAFSAIENTQSYNFTTLFNQNSNNFIYELGSAVGVGDQVIAFAWSLYSLLIFPVGAMGSTGGGGACSNCSSASSSGGSSGPSSVNPSAPARGGGWEGYAKRKGLIQ